LSQWENVVRLLRVDPESRRAVVSLYSAIDLAQAGTTNDVPCTCTLHFLRRENAINLISYTRSNDIILGFCYDIFIFTMLQELLAYTLGCDVGWYQHMVGSLHLYGKHEVLADEILAEGFKTGTRLMPPLSHVDQIADVLEYEREIRVSPVIDPLMAFHVAPYWESILVALLFYKSKKLNDIPAMHIVRGRLRGTPYYSLSHV